MGVWSSGLMYKNYKQSKFQILRRYYDNKIIKKDDPILSILVRDFDENGGIKYAKKKGYRNILHCTYAQNDDDFFYFLIDKMGVIISDYKVPDDLGSIGFICYIFQAGMMTNETAKTAKITIKFQQLNYLLFEHYHDLRYQDIIDVDNSSPIKFTYYIRVHGLVHYAMIHQLHKIIQGEKNISCLISEYLVPDHKCWDVVHDVWMKNINYGWSEIKHYFLSC